MIGRRRVLLRSFLPAVCCFLVVVSECRAGGGSINDGGSDVSFAYKFENPRFYIPLIEVDVAGDGTGEVRFRRGDSEEVINLKLKLLPATMTRIKSLFSDTAFLTSEEDYQSKKDFSHLGWVTLSAREGARTRSVRFNYTVRQEIKLLSEIFRGLATQEIHVMDLETSQQYQPLDLPRQLESIADDIRLERITEPERLLAPLREIAGSDTLPLIARNSANRLAAEIQKGKYKTPLKSAGR